MRSADDLKLATRPSPSVHASHYRIGTHRTGNDGLMYETVQDKSGTRRWALTQGSKNFVKSCSEARKSITVTLKPEVNRVRDDEDEDPSSFYLVKQDQTSDLLGSKQALAVVWIFAATLSTILERSAYVRSVRWDARYRLYVLEIGIPIDSSCKDVCNEVRDVYGDMAADTWMEGDKEIAPGKHLDLTLLNCGINGGGNIARNDRETRENHRRSSQSGQIRRSRAGICAQDLAKTPIKK